MKKILILIPLFFANLGVCAKEDMTKNDVIEEVCGATADYAKSVMDSRQNDVSLKESIANINAKIPKGSIQDYYKAIAYEAYSQKKWESDEYKNNASVEFGNRTYLSCIKSFEKELSGY